MIPEIVVGKIWWYVWRMKQRKICDEYRVNYYRTEEEVMRMKRNEYRQMRISYNWRKIESVMIENYIGGGIYNPNEYIQIGELPKNYKYSKGDSKIID